MRADRGRRKSLSEWDGSRWVGRKVAHYEVKGVLGRGGTAVVFKVLDHETGELRALKMTANQPTETELHRFKREFRVMSRLAHPNVIDVYRYGVFETRPYFLMELIEGRDLRSHLRATVDRKGYYVRVAEALVQVVRALAYIHDRHIVHRDLKPGNILVKHVGAVKVMDFGIAFETEASTTGRATKLMGTLAYVSPEQATGRRVDGRSDLYSLGVILYELLVGAKPFKGNSVSQMVYKHLHETPVSPRARVPEVPAALSDLAMSLLAKRPHDRPQTAQEVLVSLEIFLTGGAGATPAHLVSVAMSRPPPLNEPRFVGREDILAVLRRRLAGLASGLGGLALVGGEPGIGKSRLLEEVRRLEEVETAFVLTGRCQAQAVSSYNGFRDIIRAAVRIHADSSGLGTALTPPQITLLLSAFPDLEDVLGGKFAENEDIREGVPDWLTLFTAVRAIFERLAEQQPVVLMFDDLDQADEAGLALLQALVRTLVAGGRARRLFVLGTVSADTMRMLARMRYTSDTVGAAVERAAETVGDPADRAAPSSDPWKPTASVTLLGGVVERLHAMLDMVGHREPPYVAGLAPLATPQVREMVQSALGHTDDPEGLAEYLHSQSEGNPAFVEAILHALVEQGILVRQDHSTTGCEWALQRQRLDAETTSMALPGGLQGALRRRVALLDARDQVLLQIAAAFGEPFTYEMLQAVSGLEEGELLDFLDRMLKAQFLDEFAASGRITYDFKQARARESIMGDLPRQEQVLLHQRIGKRLASIDDVHLTPLIGRHLYAGRMYDEALPFLITAGERLVAQHLYRLAIQPLAQAEEILSRYRVRVDDRDDTELKLRLDHAMGTALRGIGRNDEAYEHLALALDRVSDTGNLEVEARVRVSLGQVMYEQAEYRKARKHFEAAVLRLKRGGLGYRMGEAMLGLGRILAIQGPVDEATRLYADARDLALELQNRAATAGAVLGLGECALIQGRMGEAFRRMQEALNLFGWLEDRPAVLRTLEALGEAHRITGQYEEALGVLEEAIRMAKEYDQWGARASLCAVLAEVYLDLNAPTQAEAVLNDGLTLCSVHRLLFQKAMLYRIRGASMERQGQHTAALDACRQGLKLSQGISAHILTGRILNQVARVQLAAGEADPARRLAEKAMLELKRAGAHHAAAEAGLTLVQVRLAQGDPHSAQLLLSETIDRALEMEARDLAFRALVTRFSMPVSPEGYSLSIGLHRAAGILQRLVEGAGSGWRSKLLERADIARFRQAGAITGPWLDVE